MLLENLETYWVDGCYLCRMAAVANPIGVCWPIEPKDEPEWEVSYQSEVQEISLGSWLLYCDIQYAKTDLNGVEKWATAKKERNLCKRHWDLCRDYWVAIAYLEVREYDAWVAWLERIE